MIGTRGGAGVCTLLHCERPVVLPPVMMAGQEARPSKSAEKSLWPHVAGQLRSPLVPANRMLSFSSCESLEADEPSGALRTHGVRLSSHAAAGHIAAGKGGVRGRG